MTSSIEAEEGILDTAKIAFIGLGDQGLPMAQAITGAGSELHVWVRRGSSLDGLRSVRFTQGDAACALAASCEIIALYVRTNEDVHSLLDDLLAGARPGTGIVNHSTGTPAKARHMTERCESLGLLFIDASVSEGQPAAEARTLTTLVGGSAGALERCRPIFETFSRHIVAMGPVGSGQMAALFNNTLMILNQASIAEVVALARAVGMEPVRPVEALKLGSAFSNALVYFNTMITPQTVDHLSQVEQEDIDIFAVAMSDLGLDADEVVQWATCGARSLPDIVAALSPPARVDP